MILSIKKRPDGLICVRFESLEYFYESYQEAFEKFQDCLLVFNQFFPLESFIEDNKYTECTEEYLYADEDYFANRFDED